MPMEEADVCQWLLLPRSEHQGVTSVRVGKPNSPPWRHQASSEAFEHRGAGIGRHRMQGCRS